MAVTLILMTSSHCHVQAQINRDNVPKANTNQKEYAEKKAIIKLEPNSKQNLNNKANTERIKANTK